MKPEAALEAVLFVAEAPVPEEELAEALDLPRAEVKAALAAWAERLEGEGRGVALRYAAGGWRLYTKPEALPYLERFARTDGAARLSKAALEVLAVVAYRQPVTRSQIAELRGVDSGSALRTLARRGLVEETGRLPAPGSPALYGTTGLFLETLGMGSLSDLPPIADHMPAPEAAESLEQESFSPGASGDRPTRPES